MYGSHRLQLSQSYAACFRWRPAEAEQIRLALAFPGQRLKNGHRLASSLVSDRLLMEKAMTLDWQVIVICSVALFLRSLTGLRRLHGSALDIVDNPSSEKPEGGSAPEFRAQDPRIELRSTAPSDVVTCRVLAKEATAMRNETNSPKPPHPEHDLEDSEAEAAKKLERHLNRIANDAAKKAGSRIKRYDTVHGIFTK